MRSNKNFFLEVEGVLVLNKHTSQLFQLSSYMFYMQLIYDYAQNIIQLFKIFYITVVYLPLTVIDNKVNKSYCFTSLLPHHNSFFRG